MAVALVAGSTRTAIISTANGTFTPDWSATFTPTNGNLLVLCLSVGGNATVSAPAGWDLVQSCTSGSLKAWMWIKQNCTTSDTSVDLTGNAAVTGIYTVRQYAGAKTSGAWDSNGTAEDETNVTDASTSCSTGTTGTLSQANGLGIAFIAIDDGGNWEDADGGSWSGSWTNVVTANRTTSSGHRIAELAISATTAQSATYSGFSSDQNYGAIVVLYEATTGTTVNTGLGELTITGLAPTVSKTDHVTITSGLGELTVTGYAPSVTVASPTTTVQPDAGELTLTGYAPTVAITEHISVTADVGSLSIAGYAPTVTVSGAPITVTADAGELTITGYAPTVIVPITVSVDVGELEIVGHAPTVTASGAIRGRRRRRYYNYIINDADDEKARRDAEYAAKRLKDEIRKAERQARKENAAMEQEIHRRMVGLTQELSLIEQYLDERDEADEIAELLTIL